MADNSNKTEKPTPRRLEKARKEGQFPVSRDLYVGIQILSFAFAFGYLTYASLDRYLKVNRAWFVAGFEGDWTAVRFLAFIQNGIVPEFVRLAGIASLIALFSLAIHISSTGFGFAWKKVGPDFKRLNPASRLSQLPAERLHQTVKSIALLLVTAWLVWHLLSTGLTDLVTAGVQPLPIAIRNGATLANRAIWMSALIVALAGVIDYAWRLMQHRKGLRMSKQEIKDEHKESEGSPEVKMRIRRLQRDMARRSMFKDIPTATAVIVNPTHYSVAIRYAPGSAGAPTVVAKGKNYVALRIREKATAAGVPLVENKPLAQALYRNAQIGQEIPPELYRAVAEVLAYIFKLMNGRS